MFSSVGYLNQLVNGSYANWVDLSALKGGALNYEASIKDTSVPSKYVFAYKEPLDNMGIDSTTTKIELCVCFTGSSAAAAGRDLTL